MIVSVYRTRIKQSQPSLIGIVWLITSVKFLSAAHFPFTTTHTAASRCNCMRVSDCKVFSTVPNESYEAIEPTSCGFLGQEPLVCCVSAINHGIATPSPFHRAEFHIRGISTTPTPFTGQWVWNRRPYLMHEDSVEESNGESDEYEDVVHVVEGLGPRQRPAVVAGRGREITGRHPLPHLPPERKPTGHIHTTTDTLKPRLPDYKDPLSEHNLPTTIYSYDGPFDVELNTKLYPNLEFHKDYEEHSDKDVFQHHYKYQIAHTSSGRHGPQLLQPTYEDSFIYPDDRRVNVPVTFSTSLTVKPVSRKLSRGRGQGHVRGASEEELKCSKFRKSECGLRVSNRILGGMDASPGQYPWIIRIAYRNTTNNRISYRCSGSIVSNFFVLTAAHCVVNLVDDLKVSHLRIGDSWLRTCRNKFESNGNCDHMPYTFEIAEIIAHPNYDQPKYANDIALLKVIPNVDQSVKFATICLPFNSSTPQADSLIGSTGVVAGWSTHGRDPETTVNGSVKYIRLPIVNTTECAITYAKYSENFNDPIVITPSQLCAQGQPMYDVCRGDSGGPFMDEGISGRFRSDGRHTLIGIVAFGPTTCGVPKFPGVYTRVSSYLNWIEQVIC